jgi:hypothetical protein
VTSGGGRKKLFSEVVKNQGNNKRYRTTLKPKEENITPQQIKSQLKNSINPMDIKVGIKAVKSIRDRRSYNRERQRRGEEHSQY